MRPMKSIFTQSDAWSGGNIDALMFFGPGDFSLAKQVGSAIWSHTALTGPYRDRHSEPESQSTADFSQFTCEGCEQVVGLLKHGNGSLSPFVHTTVIDDDGLWVYLGPTLGGLALHTAVGAYPFDDNTPTNWLTPLFNELRDITGHVASQIMPLAAVYGFLDISDLDTVTDALSGKIHDERWAGLDLWTDGVREYFPPTHTGPPMQTDA